jgi:hypothetical protein
MFDEEFLRGFRAIVRQEVIGEFEDQWEEVSSEEEEKEEIRNLRSPRESEYLPPWIKFPNIPKQPSGPPLGHTSTSPSNRIIIAKTKTATGVVTTIASSSVRSVQDDQKRVILTKTVTPAILTKSRPPVPKASGEASSSRPKLFPVLKEPPLSPPAKGLVTRDLALQEQHPKNSQGASSSSIPKSKEQSLAP